VSSSVNLRGVRLSICRMPKGGMSLPPMMTTLATALTPLSIRNSG